MLVRKIVPSKLLNLFADGRSYGLMKIFGRFMLFRNIYRSLSRKNLMIESVHDGWCVVDEDALKTELMRKGYSLQVSVDETVISRLLDYASKHEVHAYMDRKLNFRIENKLKLENEMQDEILIAHYPNLHKSELFRTIEENEVLNSIAKFYCGENAKCIASQMWWTFPANVDDDIRDRFAHFYHRDLDGFNFMKFFIYLTDVEPGDGGHFFVEGSHRPTLRERLMERFRINRISDEIVEERFGKDKTVEMVGKAGTVIVEDTFGLHKGQTPSKNPRLLACFVFGTNNYNNVQRYIV